MYDLYPMISYEESLKIMAIIIERLAAHKLTNSKPLCSAIMHTVILKVTQLFSRNNRYLTVISMLWAEITGKNIYGNSNFYGKRPGLAAMLPKKNRKHDRFF